MTEAELFAAIELLDIEVTARARERLALALQAIARAPCPTRLLITERDVAVLATSGAWRQAIGVEWRSIEELPFCPVMAAIGAVTLAVQQAQAASVAYWTGQSPDAPPGFPPPDWP